MNLLEKHRKKERAERMETNRVESEEGWLQIGNRIFYFTGD